MFAPTRWIGKISAISHQPAREFQASLAGMVLVEAENNALDSMGSITGLLWAELPLLT